MQSITIDASDDNRVVIRRRDLDGRSSDETLQALRLTESAAPLEGAYYAIQPGRRVEEVLDEIDDEGTRAFLQKQVNFYHDVRFTSTGDNRVSFIGKSRATSIDGPEQLSAPLLVGSLVVTLQNLQYVFATPIISGRFHTLDPLGLSGVEFAREIPEGQRDYLHQIADIVNDGGAGSVLFTSPDALTTPILDVVLDLQAARMLAGQVGLRMAQHLADGGGAGELMTPRESAIRRAALEFILLNEIGEAELRVQGGDAYEIVSDVIRSTCHSTAEADGYLARYVRQGLTADGEDEDGSEKGDTTAELARRAPATAGSERNKHERETPEVGYDPKAYEEVMAELNALVGLGAVKAEAQDLRHLADFQGDRIRQGHKQDYVSLHLVFTGNPGTGKTTVARMVGRIYRSLGLLKTGHLVEVGRSDLVAGYIGQTEEKVQKVIEQAIDGVLFIDEAYALAVPHSPNDFGRQAIDVLLTKMENYADRLSVIVAGYTEEMDDFINSNPGLYSRFSVNPPFLFEDYNGEELTEIFYRLAASGGYRVSVEVLKAVRERYDDIYAKRDRTFGNGRMVRNDYQRSIKRLARRHVRGASLDLEIRLEDIQAI